MWIAWPTSSRAWAARRRARSWSCPTARPYGHPGSMDPWTGEARSRWKAGPSPTAALTCWSSRSSWAPGRSPAWRRAPGPARARLALALGEALNAEVRALMEAGCPIVEIEEGSVNTIGDDREEWSRYAATQRRPDRRPGQRAPDAESVRWRGPPGRLRRHPRGSVQELPHRRTGRPRSLALRVRHSAGSRPDRRCRGCPGNPLATRPR